MNQIRNIEKLNQIELDKGLIGKASWHDQFKNSCYVYVGGLPFELTEGDLLIVFSQFGEIIDLELIRDRETGKSKGFAFIGFEDQRSTVLSVDNLNGVDILGRLIRVDHAADYKGRRKDDNQTEEEFLEQERIRAENVLPRHLKPGYVASDSESDGGKKRSTVDYDPEDPMSKYLSKKKAKKSKKHKESKSKKSSRKDESYPSKYSDNHDRDHKSSRKSHD